MFIQTLRLRAVSLFFFRFSKGSARTRERRSRETRETRVAAFFVPLPSRAISHARGHLRFSRFARRTTEKRETARSLLNTWPHLALQKWKPAGRIGDFGNFFNGLAKSPRMLRWSWILNEYNLYCKIVKYYILSEVCMIKTVPHSTVSPQRWFINGLV